MGISKNIVLAKKLLASQRFLENWGKFKPQVEWSYMLRSHCSLKLFLFKKKKTIIKTLALAMLGIGKYG